MFNSIQSTTTMAPATLSKDTTPAASPVRTSPRRGGAPAATVAATGVAKGRKLVLPTNKFLLKY
jgi:hypothetical protein